MSDDQHGFTTGKSTTTAMDDVLDWTDNSPNRYVVGTFLDKSGTFDNLSWGTLLEDMTELEAS